MENRQPYQDQDRDHVLLGTCNVIDKIELCQQCKRDPAEKPHTCPYKTEIEGDFDTLCNCCDTCTDLCNDEC